MSTLNHILLVDEFYVSAFEGDCCGPGIFDEGNAHQVLEPLAAAQRAVDTRLISVCVSPVSREIELIRGWGVQNERLDRGLMHLFQHQIHHRGQVHSMVCLVLSDHHMNKDGLTVLRCQPQWIR